MTELILIRTNCPDKDSAEVLGRKCVEAKLAACANISGPITSIYEWEGEMHSAEEYVLILKTEMRFQQKLEAFILTHHLYDVPPILAIPCVAANKAYEDWLVSNLS